MSEQEGQKHLALNQRDQPVELHFEGRVVVLPPYGQAELNKYELESPQLQMLVRERLVTVEEYEAAGADDEEDVEETPSLMAASGGAETKARPRASKKSSKTAAPSR
jgi:hypothetical protein